MKLRDFSQPVIVPWDFSELSLKALVAAIDMVEDRKQVRVVHVTQLPSAYEYGIVWDTISNDEVRSRVEEEFRKQSKEDSRLEGIDFVTLFGEPGSRVCDYAKEVGAGLVIMPSHGRSGISRFLLGSVAERIVRGAPCPVLVLR
ncbi:MAG TPA: universal stress protein [Pirellulaceae bacterium]|nr:universal stress protein [Pirellulaceae bacterium]HMO92682.1 universal stress protein [Pirellulaceae bacterium]HMP70570.1 universal stress protein [Pirellulaceae bacterium]